MKFFIAIGFMTLVAVASAGLATSYQNIHRHEHGGISGGVGLGGAGVEGLGGGYGGEIGSGHWDHHPQYKYEYGVKDHHTGDKKDAWEHADGHAVKGGYKMKEADGTVRVVEYVAGPHGFNAHVKRIGHAVHPHVYGVGYGYGAGVGAGQGVLGWGSAGSLGGLGGGLGGAGLGYGY